MQHKFENGIEDVAMAIASGRGIRDNGPYGILIGDERLNYRAEVVHSAVVTGAQILAAAGVGGSIEHVAFQILQGACGDFGGAGAALVDENRDGILARLPAIA